MPPRKKKTFDIDEAIAQLRVAVAPYPKAALFELYGEGHTTVFEILVACILSIRTRDETTLPVSRKLFAQARTPTELAAMTVTDIDQLIRAVLYHETKANTIRTIAVECVAKHNGVLPADRDLLLSFKGVGPKCANLALGIAGGQPFIGVDVHVHRVANRWGYVATKTPEATMTALQEQLPRKYWVEINALLVPFGKHVCKARPMCATCPLLAMCEQVGVKT